MHGRVSATAAKVFRSNRAVFVKDWGGEISLARWLNESLDASGRRESGRIIESPMRTQFSSSSSVLGHIVDGFRCYCCVLNSCHRMSEGATGNCRIGFMSQDHLFCTFV